MGLFRSGEKISSADKAASLNLGDLMLGELMDSISRGNPSIEAELQQRRITHGGDINSTAELMVFALWPADLALEHYATPAVAEGTRGYLRLALTTIIADTAERAGAMTMTRNELEQAYRSLFPQRFDAYATAFNSADSGLKHRAAARAAVYAISASGGAPVEDSTADRLLERYLKDQLDTYQNFVTSGGRSNASSQEDKIVVECQTTTCGQRIRLPAGKGTLRVRCPKCAETMTFNT